MADPKTPTYEQIAHRYRYHAPRGNQTRLYEEVRANVADCAHKCVLLTPASPEQDRALDALDQAMFLFNAAIARHG